MQVSVNKQEYALIRRLLVLERYQIEQDLKRRFGRFDDVSEQAIEDKKVISNLLTSQFVVS